VTPATSAKRYHHGDLRNALIEAGVELAREGGPQAIVLREAARRVGVSPNAAYRHFASLPDLVAAVAWRALGALSDSMRREIARRKPTGDVQVDAWRHVMAIGRGYVNYALREPGLFTTAFDRIGHDGVLVDDEARDSPYDLLSHGLAGLVGAGLLSPDQLEPAHMLAWSAVHGLSMLLLGPMSNVSGAARKALIESTLVQIGEGLVGGRPPQL
jgi:AcrR family transcriptional regulator